MTKSSENMVLRTVYLPKALDLKLRELAFRASQTKGQLMRDLIEEALTARSSTGGGKGFAKEPKIPVSAGTNIKRTRVAGAAHKVALAKEATPKLPRRGSQTKAAPSRAAAG